MLSVTFGLKLITLSSTYCKTILDNYYFKYAQVPSDNIGS